MAVRRSPRLAIACVLVVAGACANTDGGDGDASVGGLSTTVARAPGTTGLDGVTTTARSGPATATTARAGGPQTTAARGGPTSAQAPATTADASPPPGNDDGSLGGPGDFARTILRPEPATTILFERFEQKGAEPRPASLDHARSVLQTVSAKSTSISASIAVPGGGRNWSADDLRATADELTAAGQGKGRAVIHALFLKGTFNGDGDILGVAVRGDVLVIFSESVASAATPVVPRSEIEDAVVIHELGHLLGLVDLARDTRRADIPDHPGHSKNADSVMYWAVESSLVGQVLTGGPPTEFDQQDLADLRALRNGA